MKLVVWVSTLRKIMVCYKKNNCFVNLELPDLLNATQVEMLKGWNGELRFLPNFKLRRIGKKHLSAEAGKSPVSKDRKTGKHNEMC